jgi:hypothetical protein
VTKLKIREILAKCISHYDEVRKLDQVLEGSIPIPFFGNLKAYSNSSVKILTAALNPSLKEFPTQVDTGYKGPRFDVLACREPIGLEGELSKYFEVRPYSGWFSAFERVLNGAGATYGGKMSKVSGCGHTALHVDICSPIATNPTWGTLCKDTKVKLTTTGNEIFIDLVNALKPDLVITSLGSAHLQKLDGEAFEKIEEWQMIRKFSSRPSLKGNGIRPAQFVRFKSVKMQEVAPLNFIHATPFFGSPFGQFDKAERMLSGEALRQHFAKLPW